MIGLEEGIKNALDGNAILFLGSGFSIGGINRLNKSILSAADLSREMCKEMGIHQSIELPVVSSRFIDDPKYGKGLLKLIDFLKDQFICIQTTPLQDSILRIPWRRIYTTNYDNVVEISSRKNNKIRQSITATIPTNSMDDIDGAIIHINGYIINLTVEKFYDEFKITEENYLNDGFMDSPWGRQFEHDINGCKNIFFIGYSMKYDLDLQKVLYNKIHDKSIFIELPDIDDNQEYRIKKWGTLYKIGTDGIAKKIDDVSANYEPKTNKYTFKSIMEIRPDEYVIKKIEANNVIDLVAMGKYERLWMRTKDDFYLKREEHMNNIVTNLKLHNICIVHSELGNGKSIFLDYLLSVLVEENRVYLLKNTENVIDDLREVSKYKNGNSIVLIDDYDQYMGFFRDFKKNAFSGIKVIATCRTSMNILLYDQMINLYGVEPDNVFFEDINSLTNEEISDLNKLLDKYGLWGSFSNLTEKEKERKIKRDYHRHLAEIFYMLLKSKVIENKIKILFEKLNDFSVRRYVMALAVCEICNFHLQAYEICRLINISISDVEKRAYEKDFLSVFVSLDGEIGFRSAIFSQYIIGKIRNTNMLVDIIKQMYMRSLPEKRYYMLRRSLNARSTLLHVFGRISSKDDFNNSEQILYSYYDSIRPFAKNNPFFWLQFAITALNTKRYVDAKLYFDNAYAMANELQDFDTVQLDTHYARYLFTEILHIDSSLDFDKFYNAHRKLMDNSNNNARLSYVLRQIHNYYEIDNKYNEQFSVKERIEFWKCIKEVNKKIETYFTYLHKQLLDGALIKIDKKVDKSYLQYRNLFTESDIDIKYMNDLYKRIKNFNVEHRE